MSAPSYRCEGSPATMEPIASTNGGRVGVDASFPMKLHMCLTELETFGKADVAGFQPHGRCFHLRKQHEFVTEIIPRWFNQTKYSSFQRQLNLYGFQRITSGPDKNCYHHPMFLQGMTHRPLVHQIHRISRKGTGPRQAADPSLEPNFYTMSALSEGSAYSVVEQPCLVSVPVAKAPTAQSTPVAHGISNANLRTVNPPTVSSAMMQVLLNHRRQQFMAAAANPTPVHRVRLVPSAASLLRGLQTSFRPTLPRWSGDSHIGPRIVSNLDLAQALVQSAAARRQQDVQHALVLGRLRAQVSAQASRRTPA